MRLSATLLSLALPLVAVSATHSHVNRAAHDSVAHRARSDVHVYEKRAYDNARFTFYDVGL